ncbi:MAG: MATE family efflux transporter [Acutalibacteraceae bacterium]
MAIQLSDHFTYKRLLRFVLPSIVMMVFTSIYGVVDGLFVSNLCRQTPFAALNLIMPVIMILGAVGFMLGTGGSALIAKTLGEGNKKKANRQFSLLIYTAIGVGFVLAILGIIFVEPVSVLLGADESMVGYCALYARIILIALPAFMLQNMFQSFLVTAEKPQIGLAVTILAGVTNMGLDALFMAVFQWGIAGAAAATALSQCVGGILPLIYFIVKKNGLLHLGKTKLSGRVLWLACSNGISEFLTNISMSLVNMLYNFQLMNLVGKDGIAAYGVIMYVNLIFISIFLGYSIGCAPIISYNFGARRSDELKNIFKKSLSFIGVTGFALTVFAILLASPLAQLFVGYDEELFELTANGFKIYSISFIICGFSIFGSSFFTALNNGVVSAVISFMRTLVFQIIAVLILPTFLGINGIWLSISAAEFLALIITFIFFITMRKKYHYA